MTFMKIHSQRGMTVTEILMTMIIVGILAMMGKTVVDFLNNMFYQKALIEVQRDAQVLLYTASREVRNALRVHIDSPSTMRLRVLNREIGFQDPGMFAPVNLGTVTYSYIQAADGSTVLRRTVVFPGTTTFLGKTVVARNETQEYLRNTLVPPDPLQLAPVPTGFESWIFAYDPNEKFAFPALDCQTAKITFNIERRGFLKRRFSYSTVSMKRALTQ